jgi:acetoin utilization deacetylase AcuC-like enzyme
MLFLKFKQAFSCTHRVLTFSIHRHEPGFFPGTGSVKDVGYGRGRYHAVNLPLREGVDDAMFTRAFHRIFWRAVERFRPDAVVVQVNSFKEPVKVFCDKKIFSHNWWGRGYQ